MRQFLIVLVAVMATTTACAQGVNPGSFSDSFARVDPERWRVDLTAQLSGVSTEVDKVVDGRASARLRIKNRGVFWSTAHYARGGTFEVEWAWKPTGDLRRDYQDTVQLVLRSSGRVRSEWAHQPTDGLVVSVNPATGKVSVDNLSAKSTLVASAWLHPSQEGLVVSDEPSRKAWPIVPPNDWVDLKVIDGVDDVVVYIGDQKVLEVAMPEGLAESPSYFGLSNRENVGGSDKVSLFRRFRFTSSTEDPFGT